MVYLSEKAGVTSQSPKEASLIPESFRKLYGKREKQKTQTYIHRTSQYLLCLMNLEYKWNFQRKRTQKFLAVLFSLCIMHMDSRVWIYFQLISKPQGTHRIFFFFPVGWFGFAFAFSPLEKSGQWLIEEEISLEFGWGFSKRQIDTSEFIKAKTVAISLQA